MIGKDGQELNTCIRNLKKIYTQKNYFIVIKTELLVFRVASSYHSLNAGLAFSFYRLIFKLILSALEGDI